MNKNIHSPCGGEEDKEIRCHLKIRRGGICGVKQNERSKIKSNIRDGSELASNSIRKLLPLFGGGIRVLYKKMIVSQNKLEVQKD
jgi:hypothetical protein